MSELQPVPFTSIVYNSLSPDFSNFLVHTYPSFFAALFEKYQTIYGFDPIYILKKQFYHKKKNLDPNSSASPFKKSQCKMSQDIHGIFF